MASRGDKCWLPEENQGFHLGSLSLPHKCIRWCVAFACFQVGHYGISPKAIGFCRSARWWGKLYINCTRRWIWFFRSLQMLPLSGWFPQGLLWSQVAVSKLRRQFLRLLRQTQVVPWAEQHFLAEEIIQRFTHFLPFYIKARACSSFSHGTFVLFLFGENPQLMTVRSLLGSVIEEWPPRAFRTQMGARPAMTHHFRTGSFSILISINWKTCTIS